MSRLLKYLTLLGLVLIIVTSSYSQSIAPESVNSGGTKFNHATGSLSFIIGEVLMLSQTDGEGNTLGGSFTVGSVSTVSILESNDKVLEVRVFPNPTNELVNIQINHSILEFLILTITDLQGKEVYHGKYAGISNTIGLNITAYSPGIYVLSLKSSDNITLSTYKIIKE